MRRFNLISFLSMFLIAQLLQAQTIPLQSRPMAGRWEYSINLEGGPMKGKNETGFLCITDEFLASEPEKTIVEAAVKQANSGQTGPTCEYQEMQRQEGSSTWKSRCNGPMGEMRGSGSSTMSPEKIEIQQKMTGKSFLGALSMTQRINLRRLGSCNG